MTLKVIGTDTDRLAKCDFYWRSVVTMSLYRSISETDSDFALKSLNIPTHSVFNAPADAFPFEF